MTMGFPTRGSLGNPLARTISGPGYYSQYGPIKSRRAIAFSETNTSLSFNFAGVQDLRKLSVRVVSKSPEDSSSNTIAGSVGEVFPFMDANPTQVKYVSITHSNTVSTQIYAELSPGTNIINMILTASTQNRGYIIITEYAFTYNYLGAGEYYNNNSSIWINLTLASPIKDVRSVYVTHYSDFGSTGSNYEIAQGTFQPSGYYASTETILDVPYILGYAVANSAGGYFTDNLTYRYRRSISLPNIGNNFKIFEITGWQ